MRCDAVLYLIPEVITNPKRDIINPKHDITKNAPNNKPGYDCPKKVQSQLAEDVKKQILEEDSK